MADHPLNAHIVLVGGGVASISAIETLRAEGHAGRITLVSDEAELPYDRPPLSKAYLSGEATAESLRLHDAAWYDTMQVSLHLGCRATALEPAQRRLLLADGTALAYDQLLLATGARARALPPTAMHPGVRAHVIRTREDAARLRLAARAGARVVLIGGGVIGMEAAATLVTLGCDVTVLEAGDRIMARFFPPVLSALLAQVHAARGVKLHTGVVIDAVEPAGATGEEGAVVTLTGGTRLVADLLLVGVGAVPNVDLAAGVGLALRLQGIEVNERAETSAPGVYAAGDVATFQLPGGEWTRWENWTHARQQAAHAARHMLGKGGAYAELPWVWSDQYDLNLQVLGSPLSASPVVLRGSLEGGRLAAFHRQGDRIVGATLVNDGRHKSAIRKLVAQGAAVTAEQLADPGVDLKRLAAAY
jgi:NADPH-dependent 2,4-dienoyl-CoA reductase/sulfur reductase-like enzyme